MILATLSAIATLCLWLAIGAAALVATRAALALSTALLRTLGHLGPRERLASPVAVWLAERTLHLGLAIDSLGNVMTGGRFPEMISSRVGRAQRDRRWLGRLAPLIDAGAFGVSWVLTFGRNPQRGHCRAAIQSGFD